MVKGGGVCIYVKKSITSHEVDNLVLLSQDCEQIWCVVKHGCESILCGAIYRPPECKEGVWDTAINNSLEFASNAKFDGVLICGDFNHPAVSWSDEGHLFIGAEAQNSNISDQFVDSVLNLDLVQMIKEPTFIGRGGILTGNILDLIFTDLNQRVRGIIHDKPLDYKVQGHHVLTFDYYVKSSPIKSVVSPDKLNYRRGDYKGLSEYFDKFQDQWMGLFSGGDINEILKKFMKIYTDGIAQFIPKCKLYQSNNNCVWQNTRLKKLIVKKKKLWRDVRRSKNNGIAHSILIDRYKHLNKLVKSLCRKGLKLYEYKLASNCKDNPKSVHKYINDKVKIKHNIRAISDANNELITDPKKICDIFNDWFYTVFKKEEQGDMPVCPPPTRVCESLIWDPINIGDRLAKVKINKSAGPDGVHPYVLKQCALSLSFPICLLGKKSVELGVVPDKWKFANVTPVFKYGSKLKPTNYRGISLTSVLCKFIERIIADHIMAYLLRFNLISSHQHGFMSKLSTVTNLL